MTPKCAVQRGSIVHEHTDSVRSALKKALNLEMRKQSVMRSHVETQRARRAEMQEHIGPEHVLLIRSQASNRNRDLNANGTVNMSYPCKVRTAKAATSLTNAGPLVWLHSDIVTLIRMPGLLHKKLRKSLCFS